MLSNQSTKPKLPRSGSNSCLQTIGFIAAVQTVGFTIATFVSEDAPFPNVGVLQTDLLEWPRKAAGNPCNTLPRMLLAVFVHLNSVHGTNMRVSAFVFVRFIRAVSLVVAHFGKWNALQETRVDALEFIAGTSRFRAEKFRQSVRLSDYNRETLKKPSLEHSLL